MCARASAEREPRSAARRAVWHCPVSVSQLSTGRVIHSVKIQFLLDSDSAENLQFISDACDHLSRPNGRLSRTKWAGNSDQTGGLFRLNGRPRLGVSVSEKGCKFPCQRHDSVSFGYQTRLKNVFSTPTRLWFLPANGQFRPNGRPRCIFR